MSIKYMAMVIDDGPRGKMEYLVLLSLANYANDRGECWPSLSRVARDSRTSVSTVQRVLGRLVAGGFLTFASGRSRGGRSNKYTINGPLVSVTNGAEGEGEFDQRHRSSCDQPVGHPGDQRTFTNHQEPSRDLEREDDGKPSWEVSRDLGLPYRDPDTGVWMRKGKALH